MHRTVLDIAEGRLKELVGVGTFGFRLQLLLLLPHLQLVPCSEEAAAPGERTKWFDRHSSAKSKLEEAEIQLSYFFFRSTSLGRRKQEKVEEE